MKELKQIKSDYEQLQKEYKTKPATQVLQLVKALEKAIEQRDYYMSHVSLDLKPDIDNRELEQILEGKDV